MHSLIWSDHCIILLFSLESKLENLIAEYNDSLQGIMDAFPDYEIPLSVQLDGDTWDPQRKYHVKLCSNLLRQFRTGEERQKSKTALANDASITELRIQEEMQNELKRTTRRLLIKKSEVNREVYEAILNRSRARFPDTPLPDILDYNVETDSKDLKWRLPRDTEGEEISEEIQKMSFDQLHASIVKKRFVSADEMKFLILVDKFLKRRRNTRINQAHLRYNMGTSAKSRSKLSVTRFTFF